MEGIILPIDLKGDLLKKNRYTISESFYEALWSDRVYNYASLKMLISRLHSAVYNLISQNQSLWLEIRDALGGNTYLLMDISWVKKA